MSHSTEEFRSLLKAARRAGTPLVAIRTADPASALSQVPTSIGGEKDTPLITWDILNGVAGRMTPVTRRSRNSSARHRRLGQPTFWRRRRRSPKTRFSAS